MKSLLFVCFGILVCCANAGGSLRTNPPSECKAPDNKCGCEKKKVGAGCIKVNFDMGATTPWTGSMPCALKVFADDNSPSIFTPESIYAVCGYTFKRLGNDVLSDGSTPASVVFSHPNGESVYFRFKEGESWGEPDPGFHVPMDERLMMVDAQGWATTSDPVYYDLYETDGTVRRFHATNMTDAYGKLVYVKKSNGVIYTPDDMGIDIVYGPNGVRQFLTPSRLADIRTVADGYDVAVYPLQGVPAKDAATGLYSLPEVHTTEFLAVRLGNMDKTAVVTLRTGESEAKRYVFKYAFSDWSMIRPDGVEERREKFIQDSARARTVSSVRSASGEVLSREELNFVWKSWGFAATNRVEGFGDATRTTTWTYFSSGNGKGKLKSQLDQTGLLTEYEYDSADRIVSEKRSGSGMMTEVTTYSYESVDPSDIVPPVDSRPRTVVKTLDGIECERTYFVYSPLTNIVERVGTQGAAYGGTNVLRTVTAFYPVVAGDVQSGLVKFVRRENGRVDVYEYVLANGVWTEIVMHLHENVMVPVSGKTTRDITMTNARNETLEERSEAYIDGDWHVIARERYAYNEQGKIIRRENLAGQVTTTVWDCCHKISEVQPDGSTTTWDYDDDGNMVASSRIIPLDMTNVTWLSTCYEYDELGRETATWQTNFVAHVGLPPIQTQYDALGRVTNLVDMLGNHTTITYGADEKTQTIVNPKSATTITYRNANGNNLSVTGTAVTPEFHTYGVLSDGIRWEKIVQGKAASSPRFTKRYEHMLGQLMREERNGCNGSTLVTLYAYDAYCNMTNVVSDGQPETEYAYDALGNRVSTTRTVGRNAPSAPQGTEWRRTAQAVAYVMRDGNIWIENTITQSCSDVAIAPLVTASRTQITGLTAANPSRSESVDVRGKVFESWVEYDNETKQKTSLRRVPYATNVDMEFNRYGQSLMSVSISCVTNTVAFDGLARNVSKTDGRGNTTSIAYNYAGAVESVTDATNAVTRYAYDCYGQLIAITNPLGNAIVYEYDLHGRKIYEGGATYPVRYTYDVFGNKTTMTTYRNEASSVGDTTTWLYDEASGVLTQKLYADGNGPSYTYTDDGKLATRTWARGGVTTYAYDGWNSLTNTSYSDSTPTVSIAYDAMGRQSSVNDIDGATIFTYDDYGKLKSETVSGLYSKTLVRVRDEYGRELGNTVDGTMFSEIEYEADTGRHKRVRFGGVWYEWSYIPCTDLKTSLNIGEMATITWTYESHRDLLTQVKNTVFDSVVSQYDYKNDAYGRRMEVARCGMAMSANRNDAYGYNDRNELTNAVRNASTTEYSYLYDDIGNRITSLDLEYSRAYVANSLNQYMSITPQPSQQFQAPAYDLDGNQTTVATDTGTWTVAYNGENRPVRWTCGTTNLVMSFDHVGRRVEYVETVNGVTNAHHCFVYDGYLCIQRLDALSNNIVDLAFGWDPTELIATRPLFMQKPLNSYNFFYTHDGNKNVSELVFFQDSASVAAHYEYAPFGKVTSSITSSCVTDYDFSLLNPYRFSSEYADVATATVCYNFRFLVPFDGNWLCRDLAEEVEGGNLCRFLANNPISFTDWLGLWSSWGFDDHQKMVDQAIASLKNIECLKDGKTKDKVADYLKWANVGMDFSPYYNQSNYEQLPYHFNRGVFQDVCDAKLRYQKFLDDQEVKIKDAFNSNTQSGCDNALKELGKLSHSIQDYYGHGASKNYGKKIPGKRCGMRKCVPRYGVGRMQGSPSNLILCPTSYYGSGIFGNHGFVLFPEPASRAPDTDERWKASVQDTVTLFRRHLSTWCKACGNCPPEKKGGNRKYPSDKDYEEGF